jgi:glycosyltransferase involved in cell wall biosynthesis
MAKTVNVLFVTWDGPQVSYLESLFLPIFKMLVKRGFAFHVLQFTWADKKQLSALAKFSEEQGCSYLAIPVLRWPVSVGSLLTAFWGSWHVRRAIRDLGIEIVLPRSTLPALAANLALRHYPDVRLLFDADGLPHDERVDFGGWSPESVAYRLLRDLEALAVRRADAVLTRSRKAIDILIARVGPGVDPAKFHVVTNGRDEKLFRPALKDERCAVRRELGIEDAAPVLAYVGSMGEQYCFREMLEFFKYVRHKRKDARLLLLTGEPDLADKYLSEYADLRSNCYIKSLQPNEVSRFLGACDLGLALRRPSFSMQAVAPIKLGEYLLCGLPVLATRKIGDTDELVSHQVGRSLDTMSLEELKAAADWFLYAVLPDAEGFRGRCRDVGLRNFSLTITVDAYANAIETIKPVL